MLIILMIQVLTVTCLLSSNHLYKALLEKINQYEVATIVPTSSTSKLLDTRNSAGSFLSLSYSFRTGRRFRHDLSRSSRVPVTFEMGNMGIEDVPVLVDV